MARQIPFPEPGSSFLSPERLDVYRLAIEFQKAAAAIGSNRQARASLRDQLDRASVSIVLCIAEGAGRGTARDRAQFFTIARGSATECGAILDLLVAHGFLSAADHRHGRGQLVRIAQTLTRLIARWHSCSASSAASAVKA
jgi:four helix bundle protein